MTRILWLLLLLCPYPGNAQLKVGDSIPRLSLEKIYNYQTTSLELNKLDDKLVILDFWASFCMVCISDFPKMHQLQERYSGKLQVIMVNNYRFDSLPTVTTVFKRWKKATGKDFTLPYLVKDTVLSKLFPFLEYPQLVWLYKGKVAAITEASAVSDSNILKILDGPAQLPGREDLLRYKPANALLVNGMGGDGADFLYRTIITRYRKELGARDGMLRNEQGLLTKLFYINLPLSQLLGMAYKQEFNGNVKIINESGIDINERFSLEAIIPPMPPNEREVFLRNELARYFKIGAISAEREIDTYTLIAAKAGRLKNRILKTDTLQAKLSDVMVALRVASGTPVFPANGIDEKKVIAMPLQYFQLSADELRMHLRLAGFEVLSERRKLTLPVIVRLP